MPSSRLKKQASVIIVLQLRRLLPVPGAASLWNEGDTPPCTGSCARCTTGFCLLSPDTPHVLTWHYIIGPLLPPPPFSAVAAAATLLRSSTSPFSRPRLLALVGILARNDTLHAHGTHDGHNDTGVLLVELFADPLAKFTLGQLQVVTGVALVVH